MNQQIAFARLMKVDIANRLVYARAAQEVPDRVGEIFDYETSKPYFERWSKSQLGNSLGKSAGNVRAMHKDVAAGILTPTNGITFHDDERAIDVCMHITDDAEWAKCESGTYTGVSIGGRYAKKWEDAELKKTRYTGDPSEVSLVDRPAIPTATFFTVQKADGSLEERAFRIAKEDQTIPLHAGGKDLGVMVKVTELPEPGKEFEHEGQSYLLHKIEDECAEVEVIYNVSGSPEDLGAFAKALQDAFSGDIKAATALLVKAAPAKQKTAAELDSAEVYTCAAQLAADSAEKITLDAFKKMEDATREPWLVQAREQMLKVAKQDDATDPASKTNEPLLKFGSATFADEVNKKYPLDSEAHVRAALSYWGMAKSKSKYSADEQKVIGERIHAAADKMGIGKDDVKKLETVLVDADHGALRKGLITCASLAYVINSLCQIAESCEMETAAEGDDSDLCEQLYALIGELGDVLKQMVDEEVKEEVDGTEKDAGIAIPPMAMAAALDGLAKRLAPRLEKINKGGRMQTLHNRAVKMGAQCNTDIGGVANAAKAEAVTALKKMNPALTDEAIDAMLKLMPAASTQTVHLTADTDALQKSVKTLTERLEKMEKQPAVARINMRAVGVSKSDDSGNVIDDPAMAKVSAIVQGMEPVRKSDGSVDEVATATKVMQKMGGARVMTQRGPQR